jgi:hypothetical protein
MRPEKHRISESSCRSFIYTKANLCCRSLNAASHPFHAGALRSSTPPQAPHHASRRRLSRPYSAPCTGVMSAFYGVCSTVCRSHCVFALSSEALPVCIRVEELISKAQDSPLRATRMMLVYRRHSSRGRLRQGCLGSHLRMR